MGQGNVSILNLAPVSLPGQLEVELRNLCCSCGSHGVSLGLQAPARVCWNGAVERRGAAFHKFASLPGPAESQVFIGDYFRYGEAIMDLSDLDVPGLYVRHPVSLLSSRFGS